MLDGTAHEEDDVNVRNAYGIGRAEWRREGAYLTSEPMRKVNSAGQNVNVFTRCYVSIRHAWDWSCSGKCRLSKR
jgi:hypothetical protein